MSTTSVSTTSISEPVATEESEEASTADSAVVASEETVEEEVSAYVQFTEEMEASRDKRHAAIFGDEKSESAETSDPSQNASTLVESELENT